MNAVFQKLNYKNQSPLCILHTPEEFIPFLQDITAPIHTMLEANRYDFVLVFVKSCAEINEQVALVMERLNPDAVCWFAYPKKSSKKYQSDVGRDDSWQILGDLGYEGVRMIAIDQDWSAIRFREARFIKSLTRDVKRTMSQAGKERIESD